MRTIAALWLVVFAVLLLAVPAGAQEKNFGVGLMLGYHNFVRYSPTDNPDGDGILEDGEIDNAVDSGAFDGFTIEADFEYRFLPYFVLGGGLQWYGANVTVDAIAETNRVQGDYSLSVLGMTVTPRLVLPISWVRLYTGAGIGLYWRILNTSFDIMNADDVTTSENNAESAGAIGYHAMLGAEFLIYSWLGIALEDRFAFVHFKGNDPTTDLDDGDYGGNSILLGSRFHF